MKKTIISVLIAAAAIGQIIAQDVNALMYKAYLINSMSLWERAVSITQKACDAEPENMQRKFELALAQYGLLSATMADKNEEQFNKYLDATKENLESLIESDDKWAEPKAILASVYGLQMGYSPWKGMFLGGKSSGLMEEALEADSKSPVVHKLYAGSKLFTPEMFGGSVTDAVNHYQKAIEFYESDSTNTVNSWLYLDAMAFLGIAHKKAKKIDDAIKVYKRALEKEPEFGWVENVLLPSAENAKNTGE